MLFVLLAYLDRLTMPKYLINSGGDEFFMPDDNHYFWDDLPNDKYFRSAMSDGCIVFF